MAKRVSPLASARGVATIVLHRVSTDAAYASRALDAELTSAGLDPRDARLATEIVYGTLRMLPAIDARLDAQLTRGRPDPFTLAALRAATYQALALDRVPSFAIVQETVAIVKQKRGEGLGKLTNAVLRRIVAERSPAGSASAAASTSLPEWLAASIREGLGEERSARYLELAKRPPPLSICVREGASRDELIRTLQAAEPRAELCASELSSEAVLAWGVGDPRKLPGYAEGLFAVQDEGAALVGRLVGARQGERVLDGCAGRGGKTLQLVAATGPGGHVTAVDIHARKLAQLGAELARVGCDKERVALETIDLSVGTGGLAPTFDRVLVDAPCTGLGTLRRRPEILLRVTPEDPARMAELQLRILTSAAALVRPGGVLVFAVCSATRTEGIDVALALEANVPGLRRLREKVSEVSVLCDEDGVFRIGPWLSRQGGCPDVYQVVRWERLDSAKSPV
jgi:16S rRNA (cytosine967-C5)-methyltransferase